MKIVNSAFGFLESFEDIPGLSSVVGRADCGVPVVYKYSEYFETTGAPWFVLLATFESLGMSSLISATLLWKT